MESQFMELITTYGGQGIFFLLFMYLFKKQQDNMIEMKTEYKEREDKLSKRLDDNQDILSEAIESLKVMEDIKLKVDEIHKRA
jgi:predicted DNA-binding protein